MVTRTEAWDGRGGAAVGGARRAEIREIVRLEIERASARDPGTKTATIIASKGTLDWAYPPLILAPPRPRRG